MTLETELKEHYARVHERLFYRTPPKPPIVTAPRKTKKPLPKSQLTIHIKPPPKPTLKLMMMMVSSGEGFSVPELMGPCRHKPTVRARQIFYYLSRIYGGFGFPQIGYFVGNRDHTTILHGFHKIKAERLKNPDLCQTLVEYELQIEKKFVEHGDNSKICYNCPYFKQFPPKVTALATCNPVTRFESMKKSLDDESRL